MNTTSAFGLELGPRISPGCQAVPLILPLAAALPERLKVFSMCHTCRHSNKCIQIIL